MILIACVDDNYGLMFNNRRVSQDKIQRESLKELIKDDILYMSEYSYSLYNDIFDNTCVKSNFDDINSGYILMEDLPIDTNCNIDSIILFLWNRKYPHDFEFPHEILADFEEVESIDFEGSSHDKITRKRYIRK